MTAKTRNQLLFPFLMVASLFFIWGFCHAMLDVLNKHFQNILHVSKTQSGFIQTAVFGAYFLLALPSALLIRRVGYQRGITRDARRSSPRQAPPCVPRKFEVCLMQRFRYVRSG